MNRAAHGPGVALVLNHLSPVASLEQMACSPPPPPRPDCITGKEALHSGTEVRAARFGQQMEMIAHDDVTRELPTSADHGMLESFDQPPPVRIIADDFLAAISPCHHVIDGALEFDPKSSRHARSSGGCNSAVKPQTKNKVCHREAALSPIVARCLSLDRRGIRTNGHKYVSCRHEIAMIL